MAGLRFAWISPTLYSICINTMSYFETSRMKTWGSTRKETLSYLVSSCLSFSHICCFEVVVSPYWSQVRLTWTCCLISDWDKSQKGRPASSFATTEISIIFTPTIPVLTVSHFDRQTLVLPRNSRTTTRRRQENTDYLVIQDH